MKVSQMKHRTVRGGSLNIFGALRDFGNWSQNAIDKVAPYTSQIAGPIADALTGVPLSKLTKVVNTALAPEMINKVADAPLKVADTVNKPTPPKQAAIPNVDVNAILKKVMGKGLSLA